MPPFLNGRSSSVRLRVPSGKMRKELPERMAESGRRAGAYERGVVDLAEALVLADRVGEEFDAVLIDVHPKSGRGTIQIADPAVEASLDADSDGVGEALRVRLDGVDLVEGRLQFSRVA